MKREAPRDRVVKVTSYTEGELSWFQELQVKSSKVGEHRVRKAATTQTRSLE